MRAETDGGYYWRVERSIFMRLVCVWGGGGGGGEGEEGTKMKGRDENNSSAIP